MLQEFPKEDVFRFYAFILVTRRRRTSIMSEANGAAFCKRGGAITHTFCHLKYTKDTENVQFSTYLNCQ